MSEMLIEFIAQYGYAALFVLMAASMVALPVPDETLMVFAGYMASVGNMSLLPAWFACFGGTMVGMMTSYTIGRNAGRPLLERYGHRLFLSPRRLARAERWFQKYGIWTVGFGYFIPGVRHITCYLSGVSKVVFWQYVLFAGTGAAIWSASFLNLGKYVGLHWEKIVHAEIKNYFPLAILLIALAIIMVLVHYLRGGKKNGKI
ncbi:MAG TPA: DedA family protein [Bacilli bacterium]